MDWKPIFIKIKNQGKVNVRIPKSSDEGYCIILCFEGSFFKMYVTIIEGNPYDGGSEVDLPGEQSEDFRRLMKNMLHQLTIQRTTENNQISYNLILAEVFNGKNEHKYGDIAIILDVGFKDGDRIKGVALLEAKIRYDNSNEYKAIETAQLERPNGTCIPWEFSSEHNSW